MKRFLGVLLSLGLIMAFAMPAAAADLTIGGSWYMQGVYADNPSMLDKGTTFPQDGSWGSAATNRASSTNNRGAASYYQTKLTLRPTIKIVEGLALHLQIDAGEGVMGDNTWKNDAVPGRVSNTQSSRTSTGATNALVQENIEFEQIFVNFKTGIGQFRAGYMYPTWFGTSFLFQPYTRPRVIYNIQAGPVGIEASVTKVREWRNRSFYGGAEPATNTVPGTVTTPNAAGIGSNGVANDSDGDIYKISGMAKFGIGEAGVEFEYWRDSGAKALNSVASNNGYMMNISRINPYAKLKFGPVYVEAEGFYSFGDLRKYETSAPGVNNRPDVTLSAFGAYVNAMVDIKPFFAGAKFIYKGGNDQNNYDKQTGSIALMYGDDYGSPAAGTLIMWNADYIDAMGGLVGNAGAGAGNTNRYIDNVWFYQAYAGVNPTAKTNITARVSYATADKKPKSAIGSAGSATDALGNTIVGGIREYGSDKYGWEVDLTASYKIFDNLTYMVGGGYLFVGDYWKGFDDTTKLKDNYLLTHRLTLNF
jgi:hypothetical protein